MHPDKIPKLLFELIKNSRRSDRDLAKVLGFSQPTVTRTRRKLEDEKYVLQYTTLPDFGKLGFELAAFTFMKGLPKVVGVEKDPRVLFFAVGDGLGGKGSVMVTMHKSYTDYSDFVAGLREKVVGGTDSFIVTLGGVRKHLDFAGLQDV